LKHKISNNKEVHDKWLLEENKQMFDTNNWSNVWR